MPYTLNFSLLDLAGYYSGGLPVLTGTILSPTLVGGSGAAFDTATSKAPTLLTLNFTSSAVPPTAACAVLVNDTSVTTPFGDWLRSGVLTALPASPATATVITISPVLISQGTVTSAASGASVPPTMVPGWIRWAAGIATGGLYIPLVVTMPAPTVTLGAGSITATVAVSLASRVGYFSVSTSTVTLTTTITPAPSADAAVPSRVLSMTAGAPTTLSGSGFIPGLAGFLASLLASQFETLINGTIVSLGNARATAMGWRLTPTAEFSARRVTVTAMSGITLQLILADLWGPAIVPIPGTLAVSISPAPAAGVAHTYTVTVTNAATGSPVPMATVTLHNYDAHGTAVPPLTKTTDPMGQTAFLNVTLHNKTTVAVITSTDVDDRGKPHREPERITQTLHPTLSVGAAGFNSVQLVLL